MLFDCQRREMFNNDESTLSTFITKEDSNQNSSLFYALVCMKYIASWHHVTYIDNAQKFTIWVYLM